MSRRERLRGRSATRSVDRAAAREHTDHLEDGSDGDQDEPSNRLSERGRERRDREREIGRERGHHQREKHDLRAHARGARTNLLVEALLEREAIGDGCDQDPGAVVRQT